MAFKSKWNSRSFQTFSCHQDWLAEIHLKQTSNFLCIVPAPKNKKNWHFNFVLKGFFRVWGPATQSLKHNCICKCLLLTFLKWYSLVMSCAITVPDFQTWASDFHLLQHQLFGTNLKEMHELRFITSKVTHWNNNSN